MVWKPKCKSRKAEKNVSFCKSWDCKKCRTKMKKRYKLLIKFSKPERFVTLTADPMLCGTPEKAERLMRTHFPKLVKAFRKKYGQFEFARVLAWHKKNGYPHYHILQKGEFIPHWWASNYWNKKVGRDVHIISFKRRHTKYFLENLPGGKEYREPGYDVTGRKHITFSRDFLTPLKRMREVAGHNNIGTMYSVPFNSGIVYR